MSRSKLIRNCIASVVGTALASFLPNCSGNAPTYFRTNSVPSITIPVGECVFYSGSELCYRGMDPAKEIFYINNAANPHPIKLDTLRHQVSMWSNNTNLFVVENVTPESLTVRNVGFNEY